MCKKRWAIAKLWLPPGPRPRTIGLLLSLFLLLWTGSCGQAGTKQSTSQLSAGVTFGTGTTASPTVVSSVANASLNLSTTCGTYTYTSTISQVGSVLVSSGDNCTISLVSFQLANSGESFTATTQASAGTSTVTGVYTGSQNTMLVVTPLVTSGALNPVSGAPQISFAYFSTNTVLASIESNYTYFGVVSGQTGTLAITFRTNTGTASNLLVNTSSLPSGMSFQNNINTCASVGTGNTCVLTVSYAPTSTMVSPTTLALSFSYNAANNTAFNSSVSFSYQALNRLRWAFYESSPTATTLSTDGTQLYVYGGSTLYALNTSTGATVWSNTSSANTNSWGVGISADGTSLYRNTSAGYMYAVTASTGVTKWTSAACGGSFWFPTAINASGSLVLGLCGSTLKAYNTSTGGVSWSSAVSFGTAMSGVISPDGATYYGGSGGNNRLYAINVSTGGTNCNYLAGGTTYGQPVVSADSSSIFFPASDSKYYSITSACALRWATAASYTVAGGYLSGLINTSGTTVYYATTNGVLYGLNTTTGAQTFQSVANMGTITSARTAASPDWATLYSTGGGAGYVYAFNASDGSTKWSYYIGASAGAWPTVSLDGNTIYVTQAGSILALYENVVKR